MPYKMAGGSGVGYETRHQGGQTRSRAFEKSDDVLLMHVICLYCLTASIYQKTLCFTFFFGLDQSPGSKLSENGPFPCIWAGVM